MSEIKPKKEKRFLKTLGRVGEILVEQVLLKIGSSLIKKIGGKKPLPSILFLFLSLSLFAQFPNTGNKQRLGFQTTADGLTWRGSISDTASIQPINNTSAWVILDTINLKFYTFDFTSNTWNLVGGSAFTQPVDSLFFNTGVPTNNVDTAKMRWDSDLATVVLGLNDNVPNELGFKNFWLVKNQTGVTIAKGSLVYANGTVGSSGRITVAKFIANGSIDAKYLLGITAHDLTDGEDGYVISFGKIRQVNTDTFAAGAILYPSPTVAGVWTDVEPIAPNLDMPIGFCINSSSNNGTIAIRVASGYKLSELHDVAITSPVDKASLYYIGGLWRDTTAALLAGDTISLSNRINLKLNATDTASLSNRINLKLNATDTASLSDRINLKLNTADTSFLNLASRFDTKLNLSDTAAMLLPYATKGYADTSGRFYARQDFTNVSSSTLNWTQSDTLIAGNSSVLQVYRNGQILLPIQYTVVDSNTITIASTAFKLGENYTVIFPRGGGAGSGGGSGSLTAIFGGTGIIVSPSPITTTGTVSADLSVLMELTDTVSLSNRINTKQNTLVSGTTIKTVNSNNLLGSGNINVGTLIAGDTVSLSNRINTKLNSTDTASLSSRINLKLNAADTASLSNRINLKLNSTDTASLSNRINLKLNATDTASLSNRINLKLTATDTASLSNRINLKLNATDTASLSNRINLKGSGTVTSVATGYGLSGGTITTTGTLLLDSSVVFSQIRDSIVDVAIGNDTIKILKQEYAPATTSVLTWTITPKFPIQLKQYILVFRNGQLLINDQYNLTDTNKITIVSNSFKVGANYTVVTVSGIGSVGTGVFPNPVYPEAGIAVSTGSAWASSIPNNSANWNIAFNDKITNAAFSGTTTKTLTLTQYDGGTFTPTFTDLQGVTGVTAGTGLTGGTITTTGTVAVDFGVVAPLASPTFTGTVSGITKSMVGLGNVDNTSDLSKPISTATQTALNLKLNTADTSLLNLTSRFAAKLNLSDTLNMLVPYLRKADTTLMLSKYLRKADTSLLNLTSRFAAKLNISDTASMLTNYLRSGVAASTYLTQSNAASTYLPLTGGTLTGNLRLASSVGTQLNIDANDNNLESRITFSTVGSARTKIYTTSSVSSMTFESIAQASAKRGFRFISSTEGNSYLGLVQDPQGNVGIKSDATGNDLHPNTLYVNGTLGVTGNITEAGNNVLTNLDTVSLSNRIDTKGVGTVTSVTVNPDALNGLIILNNTTTPVITMSLASNGSTGVVSSTTQQFSGAKTFLDALTLPTTTATPTTLLGKDGSNVVGTVTTVAQTGLMTRDLESNRSTTPGSELISVTHNLGSEPTSVLITVFGSTSYILQVASKTGSTFTVQVKNYDGTPAIDATLVSFSWLAIK